MVSTLLFSAIEISALFSSMKEKSTNFKIFGAGCSIPCGVTSRWILRNFIACYCRYKIGVAQYKFKNFISWELVIAQQEYIELLLLRQDHWIYARGMIWLIEQGKVLISADLGSFESLNTVQWNSWEIHIPENRWLFVPW